MTDIPSPLVSADWLVPRLKTPRILTLDATFFLPHQNRHAESEFQREHIPGSQFFDIDQVADQESSLPHMLASPARFSEAVGKFGVDNETHVVIYDNNSFMASARVWWNFRVFGHDNVSVLDGGLKRWKSLGLSVESRVSDSIARRFTSNYRAHLVRDIDAMLRHQQSGDTAILDARSRARFDGTEKEPRPGLRSGHIPTSLNLPFAELVDTETGCLIPVDRIRNRFEKLGVTLEQPLVATCGSGVTASILVLALSCIGKNDAAVYDGSWSEWGARSDTPVATTIGY